MANPDKFLSLFPGIEYNAAQRALFEQKCNQHFIDVAQKSGGWSCEALCGLINIAVTECLAEGEQYLEIGTFCGRSLVGALYQNNAKAQVIDNFCDGDKVLAGWNQAVDDFSLRGRITLHKIACEEFIGGLPPIGVFFYDGNHDSGHTYEGLKKYEQYLADQAIIIVDDLEIFGGGQQRIFPGHTLELCLPVKRDVDRWIKENLEKVTLLGVTPWGSKQAVMLYERNKNAGTSLVPRLT